MLAGQYVEVSRCRLNLSVRGRESTAGGARRVGVSGRIRPAPALTMPRSPEHRESGDSRYPVAVRLLWPPSCSVLSKDFPTDTANRIMPQRCWWAFQWARQSLMFPNGWAASGGWTLRAGDHRDRNRTGASGRYDGEVTSTGIPERHSRRVGWKRAEWRQDTWRLSRSPMTSIRPTFATCQTALSPGTHRPKLNAWFEPASSTAVVHCVHLATRWL